MKRKLALIGCGHLSQIVAEALKHGYLPEYELIGVLGQNERRARSFAERFHCRACKTIGELMALEPDYTAEMASVQAVRQYSETVLLGGSNLVVLSIGAFADAGFYGKIKETAVRGKRRVYVASGTVGGFDVLRAAALMGPIEVSITSQKAAESLFVTPLYRDGLLNITERERVFSGTAKGAVAALSTHVDAAVAAALAGAGPERTAMDIDAVPGFVGDGYKVEMAGEEVHVELNIDSKTSGIAAWSVVAVLRNVVAPIVF